MQIVIFGKYFLKNMFTLILKFKTIMNLLMLVLSFLLLKKKQQPRAFLKVRVLWNTNPSFHT